MDGHEVVASQTQEFQLQYIQDLLDRIESVSHSRQQQQQQQKDDDPQLDVVSHSSSVSLLSPGDPAEDNNNNGESKNNNNGDEHHIIMSDDENKKNGTIISNTTSQLENNNHQQQQQQHESVSAALAQLRVVMRMAAERESVVAQLRHTRAMLCTRLDLLQRPRISCPSPPRTLVDLASSEGIISITNASTGVERCRQVRQLDTQNDRLRDTLHALEAELQRQVDKQHIKQRAFNNRRGGCGGGNDNNNSSSSVSRRSVKDGGSSSILFTVEDDCAKAGKRYEARIAQEEARRAALSVQLRVALAKHKGRRRALESIVSRQTTH